MKNLIHISVIALKDLKIFVSDRAALFFFILFPFLFIFLFNSLMQGVGGEDDRIKIHLATLEPAGGFSHRILSSMETKDETLLEPGDPIFVWEKDYNAARQAVEDGELQGFLTFPADFTQAVMTGTETKLKIFADAGAVNIRAVLEGMASMISSQIGANRVIIGATAELLARSGATSGEIEAAIGKLTGEAFAQGVSGQGATYVTYRTEEIGEVKPLNPANFVIPGYLVMFVFMAAATAAESIVKERQTNTLERLLATSVSKESILGGIFTGTAAKGIIQIIIFWGVGILYFKVDLGMSPAGVIILSLLMVIMSSAFAVMLATLVRTVRSAASLAVITALILAPLGGCWWPLFVYPGWLQNIAKVTPHAWATEGFNKLMLFGADFGDVVPSILALLVFTIIFGAIGIWRFRTNAV